MFAAGCSAVITIESAVRVEVISFEIAVDAFATGACGSTAGRGLDHN
jgi:hypothetical protein